MSDTDASRAVVSACPVGPPATLITTATRPERDAPGYTVTTSTYRFDCLPSRVPTRPLAVRIPDCSLFSSETGLVDSLKCATGHPPDAPNRSGTAYRERLAQRQTPVAIGCYSRESSSVVVCRSATAIARTVRVPVLTACRPAQLRSRITIPRRAGQYPMRGWSGLGGCVGTSRL